MLSADPLAQLRPIQASVLRHLSKATCRDILESVTKAFEEWKQLRVQKWPVGVRLGKVDARGGSVSFSSEDQLTVPFLEDEHFPALRNVYQTHGRLPVLVVFGISMAEIGAAIDLPSLAALVVAEHTAIASHHSLMQIVAPLAAAAKSRKEGARRGGQAKKKAKGIDAAIMRLIKRYPEESAKELWRRLENHTEQDPYDVGDYAVYVFHDKLVEADGLREPRGIKFAAFQKYLTNAKKST